MRKLLTILFLLTAVSLPQSPDVSAVPAPVYTELWKVPTPPPAPAVVVDKEVKPTPAPVAVKRVVKKKPTRRIAAAKTLVVKPAGDTKCGKVVYYVIEAKK
jgi:hypothetical protein